VERAASFSHVGHDCTGQDIGLEEITRFSLGSELMHSQTCSALRRNSVVSAALCCAALLNPSGSAFAALQASGTITTPSTTSPYDYTITLHNTGTTDIGSFWFAWTDTPLDYDFLPSSPTVTGMPNGWIAPITHGPSLRDGYAIEYYNIGGSAIAPGGSATFSFSSPDSPMKLNANSFFPADKVTTSFVYIGFPQTDPGFVFDMTVVSPLTGDANFDGIVNGQDISLVASNWLAAGGAHPGDVNADRIVNGQDIAAVASNWLHTSAAANSVAVPEPATLGLLGLGVLSAGLGLRCRRFSRRASPSVRS